MGAQLRAEPDAYQRPGEDCRPRPGRSFWEPTLPWALPRIVHDSLEIEGGHGNRRHTCRERGGACSKAVNGVFARSRRASATAVRNAGGRREPGGVGRHTSVIGLRRREEKAAKVRAGVIASASETDNNPRRRRQFQTRGSSLRIFFDHCCDRPGCYQGFAQQPRSPRQRFCSRACRWAMERVQQRERRWRQAVRWRLRIPAGVLRR